MFQGLHLDVTERLVGVGTTVVGVGHGVLVDRGRRVGGVVGVLVMVGDGTGTERLVGIGGLLGGDAVVAAVTVAVVVGRAAGAAAHAEEPEEGTSQREGHGEPSSDVDVLAHREFNAVGVKQFAGSRLHD